MITEIILHLVPNAEFVCVGVPQNESEYAEAITWLDQRTQPSWAEIQTAKPDAEKASAKEKAQVNRANAYRIEADPLFFGWQRGENTEQEWLDKVAEIRARHPYA